MPLRSVPDPAEEQRPNRSFPELVAAIYEDPRVGHETRELLLAVAYAVDLAKREDGVSPLRVARRKLGVERGRKARYDRLMAADAPRYEPPESARNLQFDRPFCEAPRLRPYRPRQAVPYVPAPPDPDAPVPIRPYTLPPELAALKEEAMANYKPPRDWRTEDGVCGAASHHRVLEKDPRTGWVTAHWFCKRHKDHADRVTEQVRAQNEQAPEPIPNSGGLLPCYFNADWERVYKHYRPRWEPPSYGLCADDWPAADDAVRPTKHSRMRIIVGSGLGDE
ncbi:hypothetical protein ACFV0T_26355 [Streptomyces sp. NPDC059582]|uniref:hypothetical protein n=1 Tax=Streptomyces sp. NPDC059582 TaxID=3346875 RepID=UPI00367653F6